MIGRRTIIAASWAGSWALVFGMTTACLAQQGSFPETVGVFATEFQELSPHVSWDGLTLYFASTDRPDRIGDADLFQLTRSATDEPFTNPTNLGAGINSVGFDGGPSVSHDGLRMYFFSDRQGAEGEWDLYMATRSAIDQAFGSVTSLGTGINTGFGDATPHISADELTIYFTSDRPGGQGGIDLYQATRTTTNDPFADVVNLGGDVNGPTDDVMQSVSTDGLTLFFSDFPGSPPFRPGGQGDGDIWVSTRAGTSEPFGPPVNLDDFARGSDINTAVANAWPSIDRQWPAPGSRLYYTVSEQGIWQATWVPEPSAQALLASVVGLCAGVARARFIRVKRVKPTCHSHHR